MALRIEHPCPEFYSLNATDYCSFFFKQGPASRPTMVHATNSCLIKKSER